MPRLPIRKTRKTRKPPPVVLTIAGSDPSGGAGLEADLKTFLRHGVYGLDLPTLLTVQNTRGVQAVRPLDPEFLEAQWKALFADIRPTVIKIGALGSVAMMDRVAKLLNAQEARGVPVVLDPVLGSTSGSPLLVARALAGFRRKLLPRCRVVTPNLPEFHVLFKAALSRVSPDAAPPEKLRALGKLPYAVLLKGGHSTGAAQVQGQSADCPDWLWENGRLTTLPGKRLPVGNIHGTGCTLASAIAANLAHGKSLRAACREAKAFVARGIATAPGLGKGSGPLNFMG